MLKEVTIGTVVKPCTVDDPPTLDELQRFRRNKSSSKDKSEYDDGNDNEENAGSQLAGSLLSELSELQGKTGLASSGPGDRGLRIGDTIEVVEGDLVGMQGKILSLDGTTVKVRPNNEAALAELGGMDEEVFKVSYNDNVSLYTIRHFNEKASELVENGKQVLLKQVSRETMQIVTKELN